MPDDYEYLAEELGPTWGIEIGGVTPMNLSGTSVDWTRARHLYDAATSFLQSPPATQLDQARAFGSMDLSLSDLLDDLPPELRLLLLKEVGRAE
jgi:hypothetical protein